MKRWVPLGLMLLGMCFVAVGIHLGEDTVVWRKAVMICMECIGLG